MNKAIRQWDLDDADRLALDAPRWVGPTGILSLTLARRWEPRGVFVIIDTYIDESGTHGTSPYMVMAGYAAKIGQWRRLDRKWGKHLRKNGVEYFHATEMTARQEPYRRWSAAKVDRFRIRCCEIPDENTLFGFTFRLDRADYENHYIAGERPRKLQLDSMYGLCFRFCLSFIPGFVRDSTSETAGLTLNFILEDGHKNMGDALRVFKQIRDANISGISEHLGTCTPGDKKDFPGLQAADGLAYGAWHHDAVMAPTVLPIYPGTTLAQAQARVSNVMKAPIFRGHADAETLGLIKGDIMNLIEVRKRFADAQWAARKAKASPSSEGQPS